MITTKFKKGPRAVKKVWCNKEESYIGCIFKDCTGRRSAAADNLHNHFAKVHKDHRSELEIYNRGTYWIH